CRPATELDDVETGDVTEPLVRDAEDAPLDLLVSPPRLCAGVGELSVRQRPLRDVCRDAVGVRRAHRRRTRARSRARTTPASRRRTASGLIRMSVCSTAIAAAL